MSSDLTSNSVAPEPTYFLWCSQEQNLLFRVPEGDPNSAHCIMKKKKKWMHISNPLWFAEEDCDQSMWANRSEKFRNTFALFLPFATDLSILTSRRVAQCTVWHNAVYPLKLAFFHLSACEPLLQGLTVQKNHIQPSSALTFKFDQTRAIFQRVAPVDLKRKLLVSTKHLSYQNIKRHIHTQTF